MPEIQRANATHIELIEKKNLTITGVTNLVYSNDTSILLDTTDGLLYIEGEKLTVKTFDGKKIIIKGDIKSVKFT